MRILIDENMSPLLIPRLAAKGVFAQHIVHLGRASMRDPSIWDLAFARDQVVVTLNVAHFLSLAARSELHPGLIAIRASGANTQRQWQLLEPAIDLCLREAAAGRSMVNRVVEIGRDGAIACYPLPAEDPVRR